MTRPGDSPERAGASLDSAGEMRTKRAGISVVSAADRGIRGGPREGMNNGEADHHQDPAELDGRHRALLRDQEEFAHDDRENDGSEI